MTERFLGKHEASFSNVEFCRNLGYVWIDFRILLFP